MSLTASTNALFACDSLMLGCASRITTFLKSLFILIGYLG